MHSRMLQNLSHRDALFRLNQEHFSYKVFSLVGNLSRKCVMTSQNYTFQLLQTGSSERHASHQQLIEHDSQTPDVTIEPFVPLVCCYLRCDVGRRPTLTVNLFPVVDEGRSAEVTEFDDWHVVCRRLFGTFLDQQNVPGLDVSVQDPVEVYAVDCLHHLSEQVLGLLFAQLVHLL